MTEFKEQHNWHVHAYWRHRLRFVKRTEEWTAKYDAHVLAYHRYRVRPVDHTLLFAPSVFRYTEAEWRQVDACLLRSKIRRAEGDRETVEMILQNFVFVANRTDPRSPSVKAAKAGMRDVVRHAGPLLASLVELKSHTNQQLATIAFAMAENPVDTQLAELEAFMKKLQILGEVATRAAEGMPKSYTAGSNRARGELVDQLFQDLRKFWIEHGGEIGKGSKSQSTLFVVAATKRALEIISDVKLPSAWLEYLKANSKR